MSLTTFFVIVGPKLADKIIDAYSKVGEGDRINWNLCYFIECNWRKGNYYYYINKCKNKTSDRNGIDRALFKRVVEDVVKP